MLFKFGVQIEGFIVGAGGAGGGVVCVCLCVCCWWVEGAFALWWSFLMLREGI